MPQRALLTDDSRTLATRINGHSQVRDPRLFYREATRQVHVLLP